MYEQLVPLTDPTIAPPSGSEAAAALSFLAARDITLAEGLSYDCREQIIAKSGEVNIQLWTPRDQQERFTDKATFDRWYSHGRHTYVARHNDDLAGIVWFRQEDYPATTEAFDAPETCFAIRLYEGYAGTGLARSLMAAAHARYAERYGAPRGMWLDADNRNVAARTTYTKFGYQLQSETGNDRVYMLLSAERLQQLTQVTGD